MPSTPSPTAAAGRSEGMNHNRPASESGLGTQNAEVTIANVIEAHEVTVRFGGITALDSLSLQIAYGARCGVIGPNGAGKTTFLDVLSGMRQPSSGHVTFEGMDISKKGPTAVSRNGLHRTFQRHQPFGWLSVEENVLVALEWPKRGRRIGADLLALPSQRRRREGYLAEVHRLLDVCGLMDVRNHPAASLPIGKVRLLEFARAIADDPKVLLLDEPTSGLAQNDADNLGRVILNINESTGCAFVLVEHDVEFVSRLCTRLVVLDQGSLLADGEPSAVLRNPLVLESYIGRDSETKEV